MTLTVVGDNRDHWWFLDKVEGAGDDVAVGRDHDSSRVAFTLFPDPTNLSLNGSNTTVRFDRDQRRLDFFTRRAECFGGEHHGFESVRSLRLLSFDWHR